MFREFRFKAILALKQLLYGRRGEPFRIAGALLRFVPGTRPILPKYRTSTNDISRYDALQVEQIAQRLGPGDLALNPGMARPVVEEFALSDRSGPAMLFSRSGSGERYRNSLRAASLRLGGLWRLFCRPAGAAGEIRPANALYRSAASGAWRADLRRGLSGTAGAVLSPRGKAERGR